MVAELLHELGYSLQPNSKTIEGFRNPDRNSQFENINRELKRDLASGDAVKSADTKKKESMSDPKNGGREFRSKGEPELVRVHDLLIAGLRRTVPYCVYDIVPHCGLVSVGVDHDAASFAVDTIRRWWYSMDLPVYFTACHLRITPDAVGSNDSRVRFCKHQLHRLADDIGIPLSVCHFQPGTSRWNKIEPRFFSCITQNRRRESLVRRRQYIKVATRLER